MKILRIIDKTTLLFIRDDFTFDSENEIGVLSDPPSGFTTIPMFENGEWKESGVAWKITEEIEDAKN